LLDLAHSPTWCAFEDPLALKRLVRQSLKWIIAPLQNHERAVDLQRVYLGAAQQFSEGANIGGDG